VMTPYLFMDKIGIMKKVLRKLLNRNMWGGKHTEMTNLRKCLPTHLRGEKVADQALKELVQWEFLLLKISTHEVHVSLNPGKQRDIYQFLSR